MGRRHRRTTVTPGLHVYGQYAWHDDVMIVGTRDTLEALADALREAARTGHGVARSRPWDGEGYEVHAVRVETVDGLPLPYSAEHARDREERRWQRLRDMQEEVG